LKEKTRGFESLFLKAIFMFFQTPYKKLLRSNCHDLVFLMETRLKLSDPKVKSSILCSPLSNFHLIDCKNFKGHRFGGIAIIWSDVFKK